jgi:hypothetical protein
VRLGRLARYCGEVLLAAILSIGLCLLVGMLAPIATNLMAGGSDFFSQRVVFDRDGIPRMERREMTYSHTQRMRRVTWCDLDGKPVGTYLDHQAPRLGIGAIFDLDVVLSSGWRGGHRNDLTGWRFLPPPGAEVPLWQKLPGEGLLIGYLYPYGRLIGYLGPQGYAEPGQSTPRFRDPRFVASLPHLGQIWVDRDRIYAIDMDRLTCHCLWTSPSGPIRALGCFGHMAFVLCGDTLRAMEFDGLKIRTRMEGPLPDDLRHNVAWQVAWVNDKVVICNLGAQNIVVYHLAQDGRQLDQWKIGMPSTRGMSRTRKVALTVASAITSPWMGMSLQVLLKYRFPDAYRLVESWVSWPYRPPFLAISLILTIVSTMLTWWHLRSRSTRFQMALGLFGTLLLSWPGHLVCRSLFDLPARVPCPACGRPRAVDHMTCPRCKARWPIPPQTGCEILLPATGG